MAESGKRPPDKNTGRKTSRKSGAKAGTPSGVGVPSASAEGAQDRKAKRAEAVAAMKQAQAARERRSRLLMAGGVVVAILIVAGVGIAVGLNHKSTAAPAAREPAANSVVAGVSSVPPSTFDTIGFGTAKAAPQAISGTPLTSGGKPEVLYVGAEYCPYCAAERWALATALARFGTLSGVGQTASAPDDVNPNTPTLSFHGASLASDYISFKGYEETTSDRNVKLDTVPDSDQALQAKYGSGAIPFIYIGGKYASSGAAYDPDLLKGMTHAAIAKSLSDPDSGVAKAVDGSANLITAAICQTTSNKPTDVCTSTGVQTALKAMQAAAKSSSGS